MVFRGYALYIKDRSVDRQTPAAPPHLDSPKDCVPLSVQHNGELEHSVPLQALPCQGGNLQGSPLRDEDGCLSRNWLCAVIAYPGYTEENSFSHWCTWWLLGSQVSRQTLTSRHMQTVITSFKSSCLPRWVLNYAPPLLSFHWSWKALRWWDLIALPL